MFTAIKNHFRASGQEEWGIGILVTAAAGAIGIILMVAIQTFASGENTYMCIGMLLGAFAAGLFVLIQSAAGLQSSFNLEISMGCTRRHFFLAYIVSVIGESISLVALLAVIYLGENALYPFLYPHMRNELEMDLMPYLLWVGLSLTVAIPIVGGFCGAMLMRFGRRTFWVLWALWMFVFLGIPRIADAMEDAPGSLFGRIGRGALAVIRLVPVNLWIPLAAAACLVCLAGTWMILRRQQVNV